MRRLCKFRDMEGVCECVIKKKMPCMYFPAHGWLLAHDSSHIYFHDPKASWVTFEEF